MVEINRPKASVYTFDSQTARPGPSRQTGNRRRPNVGILHWTNPEKDWLLDQVTTETAEVRNGTEKPRREIIALPGITSPHVASRQLAYLFDKAGQADRIELDATTTDAMELKEGDHITYDEEIAGYGGGVELTIEEIADDNGPATTLACSLYDAGIFSDDLGTVETRLGTSFDDPDRPPDDPTGLTLTETTYKGQDGVLLRLLIEWDAPVLSPHYLGTDVYYAIDAGAETLLRPLPQPGCGDQSR